jgi:ketosteroid isomerase-like protein
MGDVPTRADVARRYLASFGSGDPDAVAGCVTDDFVNEHLSSLGSGCVGRDEYRRRLPDFLATFAGARYTVLDLAVDDPADSPDGVVVARYQFQATCAGTPVVVPGVMWFEVRNGSIARRIDVWDGLTYLRQVGEAD